MAIFLAIFRLPQIVFIKIINSMDPAEQLLTALCSRRAYALVKKHRSKAINLTLCTDPCCVSLVDKQERPCRCLDLQIGLESTWTSKKEEKSIDINENRGLRYTMDNRHGRKILEMCWKDRSVGLRSILDLACDLFRIFHVNYVRIEGPEYMWIFDWFREQQKTLKSLNLVSQRISDDGIKHVILNSTAQQLFIHAKPTDDFRVETIANTFGYFSCFYGFWITIDNLISLDCIDLQIHNKTFTCSEVNRFLKHWINGGSSRLKFLKIFMEEFNQDEVFADIQNRVTRIPEDRIYRSPYKSTFTFNGFQLQRDDGVAASIQYSEGAIHMGVWPDANENT